MSSRGKRLGEWYRTTAVVLLNAVVVFVLVNILIGAVYAVRKYLTDTSVVERKYDNFESVYEEIYPGYELETARKLLDETWSRSYIYEPFTQFREQPFEGEYIKVSDAGYREVANQGPWPPSDEYVNIFIFGGSTLFGYGVADGETTASHLQDKLRAIRDDKVRVYNFGRGHYYSYQERILFDGLIARGIYPHMAIFVDGLNDFYYHANRPLFTRRLADYVNKEGADLGVCEGSKLPVCKLVIELKTRVSGARTGHFEFDALVDEIPGDADLDAATDHLIRSVIDRYLKNKSMTEALADRYGIKTLFVWQPVPGFKYDLKHHYFASGLTSSEHKFSGIGYGYMEKLYESDELQDNFAWCADIQEGVAKPLYVDKVHYTSEMSAMFADCIVSAVNRVGLVDTE
jgi:hypothetical protein